MGSRTIEVAVREDTGALEKLRVREGEELLSEVMISDRDERGLPAALEMRAPAAKVELENVSLVRNTFY